MGFAVTARAERITKEKGSRRAILTYDEALRTGMQWAQEGRLDDAIALFLQVQQAAPDNPHTHRLIGHVLFRGKSDPAAARPFFEEAVRRNPDAEVIYDLLSALMALRAVAEIDRICEQFRDVAWTDPRLLAAWGYCLTEADRHADAVPVLRRARELSPSDQNIPRNLARALAATGQGEEAVGVFTALAQPWDGVLAPKPDLTRLNAIAQGYDDNDLHNFFCQRLLRLMSEAFAERSFGRTLELGCGTGLLAARLPPSVSELVGIELSPAMLTQARGKDLYRTLIEGELPGVLDGVTGAFDTVLASCVLYYFADLSPFFVHAARLLRPGGAFVFSVDPLADSDGDIGVVLPGEYAHSRAYLRRLAAENGMREVAIEIDRHRGPPGFWCAFQKV